MQFNADLHHSPYIGEPPYPSGAPGLQAQLFERFERRTIPGTGIHATVFFFGDNGSVGANLWGWAAREGVELVLRDSTVVKPDWFAAHADAFDCVIIDAEYLGDLEDTVDFCLAVRKAAPWLPVLLISTEVRNSDLTSERMMICDATVKWPANAQAMSEGLQAALENHGRFRAMWSVL